MTKKFIAVIFATTLMLSGCSNKDMIDTVYTYHKAIISLPNGDVVEGDVQNWRDYKSGDQVQVKVNGKTYLVHSEDVALIAE